MTGRRRFTEIAGQIPDISDRLLSQRLRELEKSGIVKRLVDPGPPVRVDYELTKAGTELNGTVRALARWAEQWLPLQQSS